MAWIERRGKKFRLSFRYGGAIYRHSLGTDNLSEAEAHRKRLEANLVDLENGRRKLPEGADLTLFLLSDGSVTERPTASETLTLGKLTEDYMGAHAGAQEENSLGTARIHANHVKETLGAKFPIRSLTTADLQRHVDRRARQIGPRGKPISPTTIKKEVATLSSVWNWAVRLHHVKGPFPNDGLVYAKVGERSPFQTREEIERQIARGGLTEAEQGELWDCLFLTLSEVAELLEHARTVARQPWIYPMFCFAAHTGARRSEILRSRIADFDFRSRTVVIHEKKRSKGRRTTRRVPLSPFLETVMQEWFAAHPGGVYTISQELKPFRSAKTRPDFVPVTIDESNDHFNRTLAGSKWEIIRGWHIFRHSFASNCAAKGVDQRIINEWLGHQTDEMVKRYRHLIPDVSSRAISADFRGPEKS